ncbi:MAG: aminotransferase class V-fold PLP-dependent enzyme [Actinobacteria bacterium]|nr:MAG: aminotransferase class V-fold PLP-dependent enzyme [Actinomycetota bacterium]
MSRPDPERLRVLVREPISAAGLDLLRARFDVVEDGDSELESIIDGFDAVVIRSGTTIGERAIERATRLKVIARAGVGIDNVDVDAATRRGIVVANAPESTVVSAAEHTIALLLAVATGEFGERWVALATAYGADVHELRYAWGETPRAGDVRQRVEETSAEVAFLVHSETSTGVVADVQALAQAAHEAGALVVVDAVSSLGAVPLETDAWGLDVVVAGSQKALMTPPGLSLAVVSPAAWERAGRSTNPRFYFDWARMKTSLDSGTTPFTPAVSLVASLDAALELLLEEGLEAAFARHAALGRACRAGAKAMGLELFSPDEDRSAVVTAILTPPDVDARELVLSLRDRFGITVAGGHGDLAARLFRIGHIGYYDVFDVTTALAAVEFLLAEKGVGIERGVAVARALEAYRETAHVAT